MYMDTLPGSSGLHRIERTSVKELALEQLKRFIASGNLEPGERLPSERELAERLGVGRNSVREALKVLEAIGIVESRIGEGTFITAQTGASIGRMIGLKLAHWGGTIVDIIDARQIFEVEASRAAAERATPEVLRALGEQLELMEHATNFRDYLKADMQFHRLIAQATLNPIVTRVIADLIDLLEQVLHEARGDQLPTKSEGDGTHRKVYGAIVQRDGATAAAMMHNHLQFSTELWQALVTLGTSQSSASDKRQD
jgi:GntR family transcriptional repressor for pyruvate dehydrogenase complex